MDSKRLSQLSFANEKNEQQNTRGICRTTSQTLFSRNTTPEMVLALNRDGSKTRLVFFAGVFHRPMLRLQSDKKTG